VDDETGVENAHPYIHVRMTRELFERLMHSHAAVYGWRLRIVWPDAPNDDGSIVPVVYRIGGSDLVN
jgi:hypothetical protein